MIPGGLNMMVRGGKLDPYWDNVVLLLHMDGANTSTTILDSSNSALSVTCAANAQLSTAQYKFGTASLLLDGTLDCLTLSGTPLILGTGDFTIECFVRTNSATLSDGFFQLSSTAGGVQATTTNTLGMGLGSSAAKLQIYAKNSSQTSGTAYIVNATWQHIVLERYNGTTTGYVGGSSTFVFSADTTNYTGQYLCVGGLYSTANTLAGNIDEFRITKGIARYKGTFTPPTVPFPD